MWALNHILQFSSNSHAGRGRYGKIVLASISVATPPFSPLQKVAVKMALSSLCNRHHFNFNFTYLRYNTGQCNDECRVGNHEALGTTQAHLQLASTLHCGSVSQIHDCSVLYWSLYSLFRQASVPYLGVCLLWESKGLPGSASTKNLAIWTVFIHLKDL